MARQPAPRRAGEAQSSQARVDIVLGGYRAEGGTGSPHLAALADAEIERDASRRKTEDLRELLGKVLDQWDDIPPDLREAIAKALSE